MSGELSHILLAQLLFLSTLFGFLAGALYDVFRVRRIAVKIPLLWHFEDFFFMIFCVFWLILIYFSFRMNMGKNIKVEY